jgi:ABC-type sugar transport system substrate-binding protein
MVRFAALAAVAALLMVGCKDQPTTDIAILSNSTTNPYWKTIADGFEVTAAATGQNIYLQTLNKIGDAEEQANQCANALLRRPKAIIFAAVNAVNLIPCLQQATKDGIVLVDIDGNFTAEDAAKHGLNVVFSVASNNYALGQAAATYIKDQGGKVLMIEGASGSAPSQQRIAGFGSNLGPALKVVATLPGNWDPLWAANITQDILVKHPDLRVIFAANDQMALGAAEVVAQQNRTDIIVIGVDGIGDAVKAIKAGRLDASIAQLPYLMARQALEKTTAYLAAPRPGPYHQFVPLIVLDQHVLEQNTDPLLAYVR